MEMDLQYYRKIKIAIEIYSHNHIQTLKSKNGTIWKKTPQNFTITKTGKKTFHLSHSKSNFMQIYIIYETKSRTKQSDNHIYKNDADLRKNIFLEFTFI